MKAKVLICPQFERVRSWHRTPWQSFYISYPAEQSRTVSLSLTAGVSSTFNLNVQQYWARTGSLLLPAAPVCASMEVGLTGFTWHPLSVLDRYFFEYSAAVFHAALCSSREVTRVGLLRAIELHWWIFPLQEEMDRLCCLVVLGQLLGICDVQPLRLAGCCASVCWVFFPLLFFNPQLSLIRKWKSQYLLIWFLIHCHLRSLAAWHRTHYY